MKELTSSFIDNMAVKLNIVARPSCEAGRFFFDDCPWDYEKFFAAVKEFWEKKGFVLTEDEVPDESAVSKEVVFSLVGAGRLFRIRLIHVSERLAVFMEDF